MKNQDEKNFDIQNPDSILTALLNHTSDCILICDENGDTRAFNTSYAEVMKEALGIDMQPGIRPHEYLNDPAASKFWNQLRERALRGEPFRAEYSHQFPNGDIRSFEVSYSPINRKNRIKGFIEVTREITDRKRAETERKEAISSLQATLEATVDGIIVVGQDGKIKAHSKRFKKIWQLPEEIFESEDADRALAAVLAQLIEPKTFTERVRTAFADIAADTFDTLLLKDGRVIESYSRPQILNGNVIGRVWGFRDVTERHRMAQALKKSEAKYKTIIESIEDGYYEVDLSGNFTFFNTAMCDILGYSKEELPGMNNRLYMDEANAKKVFQAFNRVYETGVPFKAFDWELIRKDGSKCFVETSVGLKKEKGRPVGFQGITRDVTDNKRIQVALQQSETRLRTIFDVSPAGIILVDPRGIITYANPGMANLFECTQHELIGTPYPELVHPDQRTTGDKQMKQLIAGKIDSVAYERHYIRSNGTDFWGFLSGRRHEDDQGRLVSLVGIISNITEQKNLENELRQSQKMEAVGILAGGIAHEFNNILSIILGNAELAVEDIHARHPVRDFLLEIQNASLRGRNVVKQLLSFSRKDLHKKQPLDMAAIVNESVENLMTSIPANIRFQKTIAAGSHIVAATKSKMHQVISNLWSNAIQSMGNREGVLKISLQHKTVATQQSFSGQTLNPGDYVMLSVSDTGQGIPSHLMERVFEPFFTTRSVDKGSGMGLAVVHGIVKQHGGTVRIESKVNTGTTVSCYFPAVTGDTLKSVAPEKTPAEGTSTILFVDDEPALAKMGKQQLERLGYTVESFTDPTDALQKFKAYPQKYDLVITDMAMPQMAGDKLAAELVKIRKDIPVILCTGYNKKTAGMPMEQSGIRALLHKPVSKADLEKAVRGVLKDLHNQEHR